MATTSRSDGPVAVQVRPRCSGNRVLGAHGRYAPWRQAIERCHLVGRCTLRCSRAASEMVLEEPRTARRASPSLPRTRWPHRLSATESVDSELKTPVASLTQLQLRVDGLGGERAKNRPPCDGCGAVGLNGATPSLRTWRQAGASSVRRGSSGTEPTREETRRPHETGIVQMELQKR